jgi:hypothetical protein
MNAIMDELHCFTLAIIRLAETNADRCASPAEVRAYFILLEEQEGTERAHAVARLLYSDLVELGRVTLPVAAAEVMNEGRAQNPQDRSDPGTTTLALRIGNTSEEARP